ncbi:hypothetical protein Y032_0205g1909 [Ancylostoma ceylanicum]|uniref:Uncharacterized protein n=1 Tax=Ancylostoma ceylanicum TaxID=53326 RepID=A0A016SMB8_9BILA|nr:hypothetical protein Y032_0205g1909 [Ancylostoma ceylanicum]
MIVKGLLLIYLPKKGEDQQVFIQNLRSFLLAAVGLFVLLFRHPGLLGLTTLQCNIWFIISTTCYSLDRDCGAPLSIHRSLFLFDDLVEERRRPFSRVPMPWFL